MTHPDVPLPTLRPLSAAEITHLRTLHHEQSVARRLVDLITGAYPGAQELLIPHVTFDPLYTTTNNLEQLIAGTPIPENWVITGADGLSVTPSATGLVNASGQPAPSPASGLNSEQFKQMLESLMDLRLAYHFWTGVNQGAPEHLYWLVTFDNPGMMNLNLQDLKDTYVDRDLPVVYGVSA